MQKEKKIYKIINVAVYFIITFALFILNLLFSNKTGVSERENRELASMPVFTTDSYADGSFFKDYETYFADKFVFRDSFINFSDIVMGFKGYASDGIEIVSTDANLIDNVDLGVEKAEVTREMENDIEALEKEKVQRVEEKEKDEDNKSDNYVKTQEGEIAKKPKKSEITKKTEEKNEVSNTGQFVIVNNTGFETFTYNEYFMSFYYNAVNYFADNLSDEVKIYSILAPTSIEFNLPEKYTSLTNSQKDGIAYVKDKFRDNVTSVDVYSNLQAHKDEYLYFKTDHHWTALGAYRAYEAFIAEKEEEPINLDSYDKIDSNFDYLGSIYNITSSKKLEKNKDKIWYYNIDEPITYEIHDKNNDITYSKSVFYPRYFNRDGKYAVFMGGDVPFAKITTENTDKKKIMIIKDSYANAFIPFLIPHYSEIYIADPRSCKYNIIDTIEDNNIDELLFINYAMVLKLNGFSEMIKNLAIQNSNE